MGVSRNPPPTPKRSMGSPQCGQGNELMFSTTPTTFMYERRAMSAIVDANLTTMISAGTLFILGAGPVRGFAVTLGIGIITTVFTAFTLTRLIDKLCDNGWIERRGDELGRDLAHHRAQSRLRQLRSRQKIVLNLDHRAVRVDNAKINHGINSNRDIIFCNYLLLRNIRGSNTNIDVYNALNDWNNYTKTGL